MSQNAFLLYLNWQSLSYLVQAIGPLDASCVGALCDAPWRDADAPPYNGCDRRRRVERSARGVDWKLQGEEQAGSVCNWLWYILRQLFWKKPAMAKVLCVNLPRGCGSGNSRSSGRASWSELRSPASMIKIVRSMNSICACTSRRSTVISVTGERWRKDSLCPPCPAPPRCLARGPRRLPYPSLIASCLVPLI